MHTLAEERVRHAVRCALARGFFVSRDATLCVTHEPYRTVPWEILGGHLLDEAQTRQRATFESWEVSLALPGEPAEAQPLVALLWDEAEVTCFAVRYVRVRGCEAYEPEPNVIHCRPVEKLARELVGTLRVHAGASDESLGRRLQRLLFLTVVGTRLPVTSWESPLPAFQLGQCAYLPRLRRPERRGTTAGTADSDPTIIPMTSPDELLRASLGSDLPLTELAKALELALRASTADAAPRLAAVLLDAVGGPDRAARVHSLLVALFNGVALTPYTRFADNLIALLRHLAEAALLGPARVADIISYMLRHLVRHLTAFDLRTFHNRGANYPDALLLDGLLKLYLELVEQCPSAFHDGGTDGAQDLTAKRRRRRALRQACILRRQYEGLKVPATPTSPGDLQRVWPPEYTQATEEEVVDPAKRRRVLFADDPLEGHLSNVAQSVLQDSLADLVQPAELRELGMATFLDRPLGIAKRPGEVDRTPLVTYEAFSATVAEQRLAALGRWGLLAGRVDFQCVLHDLEHASATRGYRGRRGRLPARPGTPCLEDANLAAPDFVFLRMTRSSLDEFLGQFDWTALRAALPDEYAWLTHSRDVLLIRAAGPMPVSSQGGPHAPREALILRSETTTMGQPLMAAIDGTGNVRWHLCLAASRDGAVEYVEEDGREWPAGGLVLTRAAMASGPTNGGDAIAIPTALPDH
jgi:hypothetical protein